ncbi:MAG: hypothetical protein BHW03_02585 [Clostridium sp. 28_17]|nr:MAG: hypothetical protein BHW03_02585 [Clostridium sp. 28_17]
MLETWLALARVHFKEYSIYKSNFFLWTLNRIVEVVVYIFVWQAIYYQTGNAGGYSIEYMVTYYILVISIKAIATWGINEDIAKSIRKGQLNKELLSPISYFKYCFIICSFFWSVQLPVSFINFLLFIFVIILILPISFFIQMIVGTIGFYTNSIWGMQILRQSIISIFSGLIAPLTLFPEWFQKIANILPFKEFIYTPINIYLGNIPLNEIGLIILKLIVWSLILYLISKVFFNYSVKKITINGG